MYGYIVYLHLMRAKNMFVSSSQIDERFFLYNFLTITRDKRNF